MVVISVWSKPGTMFKLMFGGYVHGLFVRDV